LKPICAAVKMHVLLSFIDAGTDVTILKIFSPTKNWKNIIFGSKCYSFIAQNVAQAIFRQN
jgi:hypothetical protein